MKRDQTHETSKNWMKFHNELRKDLYEQVEDSESEYVLTYDQENLEEIIEFIKKHI
jgi:hypothetical protein